MAWCLREETIGHGNRDLTSILHAMSATFERKLDKMGDVIYSYRAEWYGVRSKQGTLAALESKSKRQQGIKWLIWERRKLKKQWKKAPDTEKEGINILQKNVKCQLTPLWDEQKTCKSHGKRRAIARFLKDPFKFMKTLLNKGKGWNLKTIKPGTGDTYLEWERKKVCGWQEARDSHSIWRSTNQGTWASNGHKSSQVERGGTGSEMGESFISPRAKWSSVQSLQECSGCSSFSTKTNESDLREGNPTQSKAQVRRSPDSKRDGIYGFHLIKTETIRNNLVDTAVQKANIPGFSGCHEHTTMI